MLLLVVVSNILLKVFPGYWRWFYALVQHACIPRAITNKDVLCQAKSGMGKTAVFVISTLQMIDEESTGVQVLVLAHTRELAYQIEKEYIRFTQFMPSVKTVVVYGGVNINKDIENIQTVKPSIIVGTPGRILDLVRRGHINVSKLRHFVVDECDHFMKSPKMRNDLQKIFISCPLDKQVMMFTATLPKEIKDTCLKFMKDVCFMITNVMNSLSKLSWMTPTWLFTVYTNITIPLWR